MCSLAALESPAPHGSLGSGADSSRVALRDQVLATPGGSPGAFNVQACPEEPMTCRSLGLNILKILLNENGQI